MIKRAMTEQEKNNRKELDRHAQEICQFIDDLSDLTEQYNDTLRDAELFEICGIIKFLLNVHLDMGRFSIKELQSMDNRKYEDEFDNAVAGYCVNRILDGFLIELDRQTGGKKNG